MVGQLFFPLRPFFKRCHGQLRRSSTCFFFPGQGAQYVGMCKSFLEEPTVIQLFDDAHKILGYDLLNICLNGPAEVLNKTETCQPAVVVSSLAALRYHRAKQSQVFPDWSNKLDACTTVTAGFSVGELTALIFSGALSFKDGLRLVQLRAQAMQEASDWHPSCMVSIMASKDQSVEELCDSAKKWSRHRGVQEPVACTANYLFPGGWVVGGDNLSLQYILEFGKSKHGIKRAQIIPVSGAFHTKLMESAQDPLRRALKSIDVQSPKCTVYSGTSCEPFTTPDHIKSLLLRQLVEPVNWMKTIQNITKECGNDSTVFEIGPGRQLRSMISRIDRTLLTNFTNLET